ncbi:MAG: hypothetical protein KBB91_02375 [Candidatus Pacebacteria bacterium]|nr:hypothetical protein [Candidatus Paceibacterota bacterium]MBP9701126.1 hypothetical protein [Candidatus Paceibacterota bacterium]
MRKNITIFASGDVNKLVNRLKIGTPELQLISGDIVTKDVREEIQTLYPKQVEHTIGLRRKRMSSELMQDLKKEIVIVDVDQSTEFLSIYNESAEMYQEKRMIIQLTIENGNGDTPHTKEMFLIGGNDFELLNEIISLDCDSSLSINEETSEATETQVISAVNDVSKTLLTVNTITKPSYEFLSKLGDRKDFAVIKINTISDVSETEEETTTTNITDSSVSKVKASVLKEKLRKKKWWVTSWSIFMEELQKEALEKKLLREGEEIEDDLSPQEED